MLANAVATVRRVSGGRWWALAALALAGAGAGWLASVGARGVVAGIAAAPVSGAAGWVDLHARRIPNVVVLAGLGAAIGLGLLGAAGAIDDLSPLAMVAGFVGAALPLLAMHLAIPSGVGFGDVKLAAVLGLLLGAVHWWVAITMLLAACAVGIAGWAAIRGWRRSIPFGTCMAVAAWPALSCARFVLG